MCIIQAVSEKLPWGNRLDNAIVAHYVSFRHGRPDAQWQLVENICKPDPSERLNLLVVVQRLKRHLRITVSPSRRACSTDKYLDKAIDAVKHLLVSVSATADTRVLDSLWPGDRPHRGS